MMAEFEPVDSGDTGVSVWTVVAVGAVVLLLVGAAAFLFMWSQADEEAGSTSLTTPPTSSQGSPTITGRFIVDSDFDSSAAVLFRAGGELVEGTSCSAVDGELKAGVVMRVTDENGTLLGTGVVSEGQLALDPSVDDHTVPDESTLERKSHVFAIADCAHEFSIPLSDEAETYTLTVGSLGGASYSRSETFSHKELASFGWFLELVP